MAYVDRETGNHRAAAIAAVALLHAVAIYAIVAGLGVEYIREKIVELSATNIPIEPPPPPAPQPKVKPSDASELTAPKPRFDLRGERGDTLAKPIDPPGPPIPGPLPTAIADPLPPPPDPPPAFMPRAARPANARTGWVTTGDYPARDLREGNQGLAGYTLAIGANGKVQSCVITQSSGFAGLDEATCKYVSRRARFEPATGPDGQAMAGSYSGTVRWVMPPD